MILNHDFRSPASTSEVHQAKCKPPSTPRNNLAHCFACHKNLNTIDLLMLLGYDFVSAVTVLEGLLERHLDRLPKVHPTPPAHE